MASLENLTKALAKTSTLHIFQTHIPLHICKELVSIRTTDIVNRSPACNNTYNKLAVQCSTDSFVVNQSLVLRINICGKNRQLLVAAFQDQKQVFCQLF